MLYFPEQFEDLFELFFWHPRALVLYSNRKVLSSRKGINCNCDRFAFRSELDSIAQKVVYDNIQLFGVCKCEDLLLVGNDGPVNSPGTDGPGKMIAHFFHEIDYLNPGNANGGFVALDLPQIQKLVNKTNGAIRIPSRNIHP